MNNKMCTCIVLVFQKLVTKTVLYEKFSVPSSKVSSFMLIKEFALHNPNSNRIYCHIRKTSARTSLYI